MDEVTAAFAKLAGIRQSLESVLTEGRSRTERPISNFSSKDVGAHFVGSRNQLEVLRQRLPDLYSDFPDIDPAPTTEMGPQSEERLRFGRDQVQRLARAIDQALEIRAHSELAAPNTPLSQPRIFVSHGRAADWREVQAYVEKDIGLQSLELEQEPNLGRTVLDKLKQASEKCTSAVIVMTGDDIDAQGVVRARENVLHEIGYFQGKYGLSAVCLLHEEGTNIPSNIQGLVYIPFPKGHVRATFGALARELKHFYGR